MSKKRDRYGDKRPIRHNNAAVGSYSSSVPIRGRKRSGRIMARWITYGGISMGVIAVMVLGVGTYYAWQNNRQLEHQLSETYSPMFKVKYPELGRQVIINWFRGQQAPISVSSNVKWPNVEPLPSMEPFVPASGSPIISDVTFLGGIQSELKMGSKQLTELPEGFGQPLNETLNYYGVYNNMPYAISISLLVSRDSDIPPILMSAPTLQPYDESVSFNVTGDPDGMGLEKVKVPNTAVDAIQTWATAWASNDSGALKQITKDSTASVYRGLGGWTVDTPPKVNWSYEVISGGKRYVAAQISFDMWQMVNAPQQYNLDGTRKEEGPPVKFTVRQTMEILLSDVESGLPAILAWTPSGGWSSMDPLMNGMPSGSDVGVKADGEAFLSQKANRDGEGDDPGVTEWDEAKDDGTAAPPSNTQAATPESKPKSAEEENTH